MKSNWQLAQTERITFLKPKALQSRSRLRKDFWLISSNFFPLTATSFRSGIHKEHHLLKIWWKFGIWKPSGSNFIGNLVNDTLSPVPETRAQLRIMFGDIKNIFSTGLFSWNGNRNKNHGVFFTILGFQLSWLIFTASKFQFKIGRNCLSRNVENGGQSLKAV